MSDEPSDRERWEQKYRADPEWAEQRTPDPFVLRALDLCSPPGRAVDLAGGNGRHALELARRGWEVELWDVSPTGLALAERAASAAGLCLATREVDLVLERPLVAAEPFDLAVIANFRARDVLAELPRLLRPGGQVVHCHYTTEWPGEKPPAKFRLAPGELAAGLPGFELVLHEEQGGRAGVLCRRTSTESGTNRPD